RHGLDAKLLRDRRVPVYDIDFEQNDIRILFDELFESGADPSAGAAPLRIKIHNRDFALSQHRRQLHLFAPDGNDAYFNRWQQGGFGSGGFGFGGRNGKSPFGGSPFGRSFGAGLGGRNKLRRELGQPHRLVLPDFEHAAF